VEFSLSQQILKSALAIVGGEARLARRLLVPRGELRAWLAGRQRPPTPVFLVAVDIVVGAGDSGEAADAPILERRRRPRPAIRHSSKAM
jgi:hypothetical protein